ncbi:tetratricopeptide repeat protein [Paraflavitalea speifideaquila]|uniref:tetratricopeptide repeat protein n=1 Tax=Paraflavitalea speifideaquila TaxID=3076558 RepID=UPI003312FDE9
MADTGQPDKAVKAHTQAIAINPKAARYYTNRGVLALLKQSFDEANNDCSQAIELDPDNVAARFNRGEAYKATSQYDRLMKITIM